MATLKERVASIEKNRFADLAGLLDFEDNCLECNEFDSTLPESFRCAMLGSCPGITLSEELKQYIIRKLIEEKQ